MDNTRQLYVQAVLDGQLSAEYITDKELMSVHLKLWEKMLEEYLPQSAVLLH